MTYDRGGWDDHYYERPQLDTSWMADAACRGTDPELWYPPKGDTRTAAEARAVCGGCPAQVACLAHALAAHEVLGTWGGISAGERRRLRRRERREKAS